MNTEQWQALQSVRVLTVSSQGSSVDGRHPASPWWCEVDVVHPQYVSLPFQHQKRKGKLKGHFRSIRFGLLRVARHA